MKYTRHFLLLTLTLALALLSGCGKQNPEPAPAAPDTTTEPAEPAEPAGPPSYAIKALGEMTLREKVGQLFNVRPEALAWGTEGHQTNGSNVLTDGYKAYPCGGLTLYAANILNPDQIKQFTAYLHELDNYPLLCIDEEGGRVARIGKNSAFSVPTYTSMAAIGATGDSGNARLAGRNIGSYLSEYGFDIDFAPVSDVNTNPENIVIGDRSFGSSPELVGGMVSQFLLGLRQYTVEGCLKHFPGHGDTRNDTHYGYAESLKSWAEISACEMIPFRKGIESGAKLVMTAHICLPNVTGGELPSTLSSLILREKLRGELGFQGIIITDSMSMGAITQQYDESEAAIRALEAGCDIILDPADYRKAFDAVVNAVQTGRITEDRLDESVARVLELKKNILSQRGQLKGGEAS